MKRIPIQAQSVMLFTLGCAKNEADSRAMRNALMAQGFKVCEHAGEADFILLNTCAFIEAAVEESLDTILEIAALDRVQRGETRLVVAGCLPSRFGDALREELPEVAAFVTVDKEKDIGLTLRELSEQGESEQAGLLNVRLCEKDGSVILSEAKSPILAGSVPHYVRQDPSALPQDDIFTQPDVSHEAPLELPWAYVKISDGCSRSCAYCTIPFIRGAYHSYELSQIRLEISDLISQGAREIILIGQDTGVWSEPKHVGESQISEEGALQSLAQLLACLASEYPHTWFRVMYLQPQGITDELLQVIAEHSNIARYLDIPLQHADAGILKAMNRAGSAEDFLLLIKRIRKILPNAVLRTTVMTGFPGEDQYAYDELYSFLEKARFNYVGIFAYSREEGTVAAELPGQVAEETALERVQALRDLTDTISIELLQEQVGCTAEVLVCGKDEEGWYGRTQGQAPEVDGLTYLSDYRSGTSKPLAGECKPGEIVSVRIVDAVLYDLMAEIEDS